jgi:hypothetical protein
MRIEDKAKAGFRYGACHSSGRLGRQHGLQEWQSHGDAGTTQKRSAGEMFLGDEIHVLFSS